MIKTIIKYFIYDFCIDIIFNTFNKNFLNKKEIVVPNIGEYFAKISYRYMELAEVYNNCTIVDATELDDYNELSANEKKEIILAISYVTLTVDDEIIEEDSTQYFSKEEYLTLLFQKYWF